LHAEPKAQDQFHTGARKVPKPGGMHSLGGVALSLGSVLKHFLNCEFAGSMQSMLFVVIGIAVLVIRTDSSCTTKCLQP
jgi:hypothetical protein